MLISVPIVVKGPHCRLIGSGGKEMSNGRSVGLDRRCRFGLTSKVVLG